MFIMNVTDRYRLEALMELAEVYPEGRPAAQVAARRNIPQAYLSRLLADLVRTGWVRSRRGPGGGVTLALSPESIPVTAVFAGGPIDESLPPALARLTKIINSAFERSTSELSIADLVCWDHESTASNDYSI